MDGNVIRINFQTIFLSIEWSSCIILARFFLQERKLKLLFNVLPQTIEIATQNVSFHISLS